MGWAGLDEGLQQAVRPEREVAARRDHLAAEQRVIPQVAEEEPGGPPQLGEGVVRHHQRQSLVVGDVEQRPQQRGYCPVVEIDPVVESQRHHPGPVTGVGQLGGNQVVDLRAQRSLVVVRSGVAGLDVVADGLLLRPQPPAQRGELSQVGDALVTRRGNSSRHSPLAHSLHVCSSAIMSSGRLAPHNWHQYSGPERITAAQHPPYSSPPISSQLARARR